MFMKWLLENKFVEGIKDRFTSDVYVRTWDTHKDSNLFPPELNDKSLAVPWLADRPSFGICFSGGGTRSATATLGQLRALKALGWIDKARYISANSGGAWTAVPFTYLPDNFDDEYFLGEYIAPNKINDKMLKSNPGRKGLPTMVSAISQSTTGDKLFRLVKGDEAYSNIVGKIFLDPFHLFDARKFFSLDEKTLQTILESNEKLKKEDFFLVHKERPFLILLGTLLGKQRNTQPEDRFLFEMTPLYVGVRNQFTLEGKGKTKILIGGGYVEPLGYDSYAPESPERDKNERRKVSIKGKISKGENPLSSRYRFTLADAIGVSSAAPSVTLSDKRIPDLIFPEFHHWAVDRDRIDNAGDDFSKEAVELPHGDGGDIDNLAIMPLLVRGVENILVFINTRKKFNYDKSVPVKDYESVMTDDLVSLFVETTKLKHNIVLAGGEKKLDEIIEHFQAQRSEGKPLVYCAKYSVITDKEHGFRHGINKAYNPKICWVYLDCVISRKSNRIDSDPIESDWIKAVNKAGGRLSEKLKEGNSPFDNFPHYQTIAEQGALLIDLDPERVNALSNLTAWTVFKSADEIARGLIQAALSAENRPDAFE